MSLLVFLYYGVAQISLLGTAVCVAQQALKKPGSYLVRRDGDVMLFCKPMPLRRAYLAALGFIALFVGNVVAAAQALQDPGLIYLGSVVGLGFFSFILYMSGPDDIRLDSKQCTYERTVGWPWKPKTLFGSFSDVKGICISPRNTVLLLLRKPDFVKSTGAIVLSSCGLDEPARALAEELSQRYGFPIVPYPKNV